MLYDKKKIYEQAIAAIKDNNLFFISDIVAWLPCQKTWFYDAFPEGSEESETFKALLDTNKTRTKSAIRAKLFKGDKAAELLALYRLICTPEEHRLLNQQYLDATTNGKDIVKDITITDEQLTTVLNAIKPAE